MKRKYGVLSNFQTFLDGLLGRGMRYVFHGTKDEWDALTDEEKDRYDQAEIAGDYTIANTAIVPDYSAAQTITLPYIVQQTGYVTVQFRQENTTTRALILVNNVTVDTADLYGQSEVYNQCFVPVSQDDVVTARRALVIAAHFIPCKVVGV